MREERRLGDLTSGGYRIGMREHRFHRGGGGVDERRRKTEEEEAGRHEGGRVRMGKEKEAGGARGRRHKL